MFGLKIDAAKLNFFDRARVINAFDRATGRVLSRFGAYVRQRARTSIRKRKAVSEPGSPPSSHTDLLRRWILFAFDREAKSVVIGPALLNRPSDAPELLEKGGVAVRTVRGKSRQMHYRARPYMGPAFAAEIPKLPAMWADSVK